MAGVATRFVHALAALFFAVERASAGATSFALRRPRTVFAVTGAGLGIGVGLLVSNLAALLMPFNGLAVAAWCIGAVAIVMAAGRSNALAVRVAAALFASTAGLLAFRVIYDLVGLPYGGFRSDLIGIFGLICGAAAFIKSRG